MQDSHGEANRQAAESRLRVGISNDLQPPSASHQLLMAFHFGAGASPIDHLSIVSPGLAPISGGDQFECWWYDGEVRHRSDGRIHLAQCNDYAIAICTLEEEDDIERTTRDAYMELLSAVSRCRQGRLVKIWNYIGRINDGDADAERYRRFSVGRADAFARFSIKDELSPTGTAIGTHRDSGLAIIAIATGNDFNLIENPRQVSAFLYPRQFGPSSPKFGRGGFVSTNDHWLYLISGTASVVGYESLHPFDARKQLDEILRNLNVLCESLSRLGGGKVRLGRGTETILRVYLRRQEDAGAIETALQTALALDEARLLMLQGDICRRELMVEIDGITVR